MKKYFSLFFAISLMLISLRSPATSQLSPKLAPLQQFFVQQHIAESSCPSLTYIEQSVLPLPYDFLLTQPLMTIGIADYYQRTPMVRPPLYAVSDAKNKTYARAVIMVVDKNAQRDDALAADKIGESNVAELGLITINMTVVPATVMEGVVNNQVPFGALLKKYNVKTRTEGRRYFKITCDATFSQLLGCPLNTTLYGRTNTLIGEESNLWVAQVVEILTGVKKISKD
jgi:hypothetical protein